MRLLPALVLVACGAEYDIVTTIDVHPDDVTECAFVPVEDAPGLSAYDCNPVFTTSGEGWADTMGAFTFLEAPVMGHPFYQVWYTGWPKGGGDGDMQVGTAVSADGTTWTPHADNPGWPTPPRDAWDGGSLQQIKVAWDAEARTYRMLYGGIARDDAFFGIGVAASPDGLDWERMPANPVFSLSAPYAGVDLSWPVALDITDGRARGLFAGAGGPDRQDLYQIVTDDPDRWDASTPQLLLKAGTAGAWDDEGFIDAAIAELDGVQWLFYVGFGTWLEGDNDTRWVDESFLGLARSDDGGETWERQGQLPVNQTKRGEVISVAARVVGPRIHVWVGDRYRDVGTSAIGYFLFEPEAE